jgi:hypothetical protein
MRHWLAHLGSENPDGDDPEIRLAALKTPGRTFAIVDAIITGSA